MVSGGRGGGLPRVSEAQMSRAEHLPAPIGGPLRPEPDLFLPGRQQEQGKPTPLGAAPGGTTPRRHLCGADDRGRAPDRGRPACLRQPAAKTFRKRARAGAGEGFSLTGPGGKARPAGRRGWRWVRRGGRESGTPAGLASSGIIATRSPRDTPFAGVLPLCYSLGGGG